MDVKVAWNMRLNQSCDSAAERRRAGKRPDHRPGGRAESRPHAGGAGPPRIGSGSEHARRAGDHSLASPSSSGIRTRTCALAIGPAAGSGTDAVPIRFDVCVLDPADPSNRTVLTTVPAELRGLEKTGRNALHYQGARVLSA